MPVGRWVSRTAESVVFTPWPPGPGRAVDVDAQLLLVDLDVVGALHHRRHLDPGERGLPAALVVERRDADEPVGALLDRERAVGERGVHRERGRLDPGLLGVGGVVDVGAVAVPLGPAQVHPHQHLGEVGGVDPAGLGPDGDQRLALVVLARQQGAHLQRGDVLAQLGPLGVGVGDRARRRPRPRPARRAPGRSSSRRRSSSSRRSSPWACASRLVTFCAASGSFHRSGCPAWSDEVGDLGAQRGQVGDRLDALQGAGELLQVGGGVGVHNAPGYAVARVGHVGRDRVQQLDHRPQVSDGELGDRLAVRVGLAARRGSGPR